MLFLRASQLTCAPAPYRYSGADLSVDGHITASLPACGVQVDHEIAPCERATWSSGWTPPIGNYSLTLDSTASLSISATANLLGGAVLLCTPMATVDGVVAATQFSCGRYE